MASRSTSSRSAISDSSRTRGDDDQKDQDQDRDRALQQGLGGKQAQIGRRGNDARVACNDTFPAVPLPGKCRAFGRDGRVRSGHLPSPLKIPLADPATPHIRIIHKESKVIRLVQWQPAKRLRIAENSNDWTRECQFSVRSTISRTSADRSGAPAIRSSASRAFAWRPASSDRHDRSEVARRAASCGLLALDHRARSRRNTHSRRRRRG